MRSMYVAIHRISFRGLPKNVKCLKGRRGKISSLTPVVKVQGSEKLSDLQDIGKTTNKATAYN